MAFAGEMKQEWRRFKDDRPGIRFENHRQRMEQHPRWHQMIRAVIGGAFVVLGIAFCFLPGPGLLGIVFGLALLAGMSRRIAGGMDRAEPRVRHGVHRSRTWWHRLPHARRALLIGFTAIVVAMGIVVVWRDWLVPALS